MAATKSSMPPAAGALLAIAGGAVANIVLASGVGQSKLAAWLITMLMIVLLCAAIGRAITNRWDAVLIDGRNRVSLSRLQMMAWTLLVLSALITAAASNLHLADNTGALAIDIRDELLAAMGLAATSLAAAPALLTLKTNAAGQSVAAGNNSQSQASWLDMFRGDEVGEEDSPDLSKIQQFLITLALVGSYGFLIGDMFYDLAAQQKFDAFPELDEKFIWLLGISHAGYLTYKAAPRPGTAANPAVPTTAPVPPAPPAPAPTPDPTPPPADPGD